MINQSRLLKIHECTLRLKWDWLIWRVIICPCSWEVCKKNIWLQNNGICDFVADYSPTSTFWLKSHKPPTLNSCSFSPMMSTPRKLPNWRRFESTSEGGGGGINRALIFWWKRECCGIIRFREAQFL